MNELSANSLANASALSNIDGLTLQVVSVSVPDKQMVNIRIMNSDQKTVRYLSIVLEGALFVDSVFLMAQTRFVR